MKINDTYYHYNETGRVYWGMGKFEITKIKEDYKDIKGHIELSSTDNDGKNYGKTIPLDEFKKEYFLTIPDAWIRRKQRLNIFINKWKQDIENAESNIEEINNILESFK
jgi:hypothetical protein